MNMKLRQKKKGLQFFALRLVLCALSRKKRDAKNSVWLGWQSHGCLNTCRMLNCLCFTAYANNTAYQISKKDKRIISCDYAFKYYFFITATVD